MIYNITQMRDFLKCPEYSYIAHGLRRVPYKTPVNLDVGKIFHEYMHHKLTNDSEVYVPGLISWVAASDKARHEWNKFKLWLPAENFDIPDNWHIEGVELPLIGSINNIRFQGRLDALVKYNGKYWSLQWKTYTNNLLGLIERVRLSWHESAYQHLAVQNNFVPWGGTILGACQKLPEYRLVPDPDTGKKFRAYIDDDDRKASLSIHFLARSGEVQEDMLLDLGETMKRMHDTWSKRIRNYDYCWGPHGRTRCPYFDVCHNGAPIESPQFKDAEIRYDV